jgi:hypothetical protein
VVEGTPEGAQRAADRRRDCRCCVYRRRVARGAGRRWRSTAGTLGTEAALGAGIGAGGTAGGTAGLFGAAPTLGASALTVPTAGSGALGMGGLGLETAGAATPFFTAGGVAPGVLAPEAFTAGGAGVGLFGPALGSPEAASVAALQGPGAGMTKGMFDGVTAKNTIKGLNNANRVMNALEPPKAPQAPQVPRPPSPESYGSFAQATGLAEPKPGDPGYEEYMRRKYGNRYAQ